jgi:hypothetical protein
MNLVYVNKNNLSLNVHLKRLQREKMDAVRKETCKLRHENICRESLEFANHGIFRIYNNDFLGYKITQEVHIGV